MQSITVETTPQDHHIAWLAALAIAIHIAESALPSPLPGVKPGLANVITLWALLRYGWGTAAWISGLRLLVGSLLLGTFLSPTFLLSASGAVASLVMLGLAVRLPVDFSAIGLGLLAAMAHMAGQFTAAYTVLVPHPGLFHLLPVLMSFALVFGLVSGSLTRQLIQRRTGVPA